MFLRFIRSVFVLVTTAVAVPYSLAIVANILNGWPQTKDKYRRALHPQKVLRLNYVLIQMLKDKTRYIPLFIKWKQFYKNIESDRVFKNLTFGRNDCTMDMYLPIQRDPELRAPVVIFVYGGSWSSGDKSMYGMLCSQVVAATGAITVCPNYSLYPKGYVDDMIQDVVDCISWVMENVEDYGGDKEKIILMGHSAGAHLASMAILELLHHERISVQQGFRFHPAGDYNESLAFAESHYSSGHHSSGSSESFAVVSENGAGDLQSLESSGGPPSVIGASNNAELVELSTTLEGLSASTVVVEASDIETTEAGEEKTAEDSGTGGEADGGKEGALSLTPKSGSSVADDDDDMEEDSGDDDSVITVRPKDIQRRATLVDTCRAVKAFIGLSGVYSIGDHFEHESSRGIEDVSFMSRAHYGDDHFQRFSPTQILTSLDKGLSLPLMVLVHGTGDYIVPESSAHRFSSALSNINANVKVRIIPECDHYEICLDLMESDRKFYPHVMGIVMETVAAVT